MNTMEATFTAALAVASLSTSWPGNASAQSLQDLHRITDGVSSIHVEYHKKDIPKGKEVVLADLQGPAKITYWYITDMSYGKLYTGLVLKVYWDDETEPSVHVPMWDFFGAIAGKMISYQSAPMQINGHCYMCYLPMPFAKRARVVLANDGDRDYSQHMAYGFDYEKDQQYAGEKGRLHCEWRRSNPVRDGAEPLDKIIKASQSGGKAKFNSRHVILEAKGRGHYVGNFLQVHTKSPRWWGEGVTFFHLDGAVMVHSPGTEDEYGWCWGTPSDPTFAHPLYGHLQNQGGTHSMYRWNLVNPVRFRESFKVDIQSLFAGNPIQPGADDLTSVAYWYQEEPHKPFALQPFEERTAPSKAKDYMKSSSKGEDATGR
jgi:hypothetical protein